MVCSIKFDSGTEEYHDVPLISTGGGGPTSYAGVIPQVGSRVIVEWLKVGLRDFKPVIVGFLTTNVTLGRDFAYFSAVEPSESQAAAAEDPSLLDDPEEPLGVKALKLRKAYPGDFLASSSGGSDILLDRDVNISNSSGVELNLRDADQSALLNSLTYHNITSAGVHSFGLVKRNAFNFLPDVYGPQPFARNKPWEVDTGILTNLRVPSDTPAYTALLEQRLIKEDGSANFVNPNYKFVTETDGIRTSYVFSNSLRLDQTYEENSNYLYTEDRRELKHTTDGVMSVLAESDGFDVDYFKNGYYIEDVVGTVVGNDSYTEDGRRYYKRVLGGRLFSTPSDKDISKGFQYVDLTTDALKLGLTDRTALARLFKITSPTSTNKYTFAVTKEGRVYLNIPASLSGDVDEVGRSVDMSIAGLVKAVIGSDTNFGDTSLDLVTKGGINLDIGTNSQGNSINLTLRGKIKRVYTNEGTGDSPIVEDSVNGNMSLNVAGSHISYVQGGKTENVEGVHNVSALGQVQDIGPGGHAIQIAGDSTRNIIGSESKTVALPSGYTYLLGHQTDVMVGYHNTNLASGVMTRTVLAGVGLTDTVGTGTFTQSVGAGAMTANVASGSYAVSVGTGPIALSAAAGVIGITSQTNAISATVVNKFTAPITNIGAVQVGFAVAGVPGPPGPHLDYLTGLPILGLPTIQVG